LQAFDCRGCDPVVSRLVQPTRIDLALLDPQLRGDLWIVATHLLDEPHSVLAPDEHLEVRRRAVGAAIEVDQAGPVIW
jgi:hypothetical protein